jgi:hypothetical protein
MKHRTVLLISFFIILTLTGACGRRGDPVAVIPYIEIGVVSDLRASESNGDVHLSWGMPDDAFFPLNALKGFVIFRAEVPQGVDAEKCDCEFKSLDFIKDKKSEKPHSAPFLNRLMPDDRDPEQTFEYLDKKTMKNKTYLYKVLVMDKNNKMGSDSNIVLVKKAVKEAEGIGLIQPEPPSGLKGIYIRDGILLSWNEVRGQKVKFYRVYRSNGANFLSIGETVTPAFTDKNIVPSMKYYYKVIAVGDIESLPSEEIEITTEETR